jgi:hypothetical protein
LHRRAAATIGNVRDIDPDRCVEQRAGEMDRAAYTGRAVLHLGLVRFGIRDELLQIVSWQILARD